MHRVGMVAMYYRERELCLYAKASNNDTSDKDTTTSTATPASSPVAIRVIAEVYPDSSLRIAAYAPKASPMIFMWVIPFNGMFRNLRD